MKKLDLQSEKYQPTGSISAAGVKNQLGRPRIDRLTLLVREAVQNSWDARQKEDGPVRFGMAGYEIEAGARRTLTEIVFKNTAEKIPLREQLSSREPAALLAVYDRGTVGLSGPTRADAPTEDGVQPNFVNLLRNVGQPPARIRGGGTYGFGKTALFLASRVRAIIAHSQIRQGRSTEQRFIAAALGEEFARKSMMAHHRFTGRHWWGRAGRGGIVEPLTGREAASLAKSIGLPPFEDAETGTTLAILFPDFEDRAPEQAMRFMADAILRNFWPKMIDGPNRRATMRFDLSWNGDAIPVQKPQDVPPLNGFVEAFHNLQNPSPSGSRGGRFIRPIECQKPIEHLGKLSLCRFPVSPRIGLSSDGGEDGDPFKGPSHHVALMRGPHFVVKYLEGPAVPYDQVEYAGVFVASGGAEFAFSRSEPPTHDDWVADALDDRHHKTFVRVATRRIRDVLDEYSGARDSVVGEATTLPLGEFSDMLGGLIPTVRGSGAGQIPSSIQIGSQRTTGARPTGPGRPQARLAIGEHNLELVDGAPALLVQFDVDRGGIAEPITVIAKPCVMLEEGSSETEPPAGADIPTILRWTDARGKVISSSDRLTLATRSSGPWTVAVSIPRDASVAVDLTLESEATA